MRLVPHPCAGRATASADGSIIATLYSEAGIVTIRIIDAHSSAERSRFEHKGPAALPVLAADGSRLVVMDSQPGQGTDWWVLDTRDGRVLGRLHVAEPCCRLFTYLTDPGVRYLYRVITPGPG